MRHLASAIHTGVLIGQRQRQQLIRSAITVMTLALLAPMAHAQLGFQYNWNKPAGGNYAANANWSPAGIPDAANEGALFNLNATYDVQLPASDVTVNDLQISQGAVTFGFANAPQFSPDYEYIANSLSIASGTGSPASLTTFGGDLTATGSASIGASGQGNLTVGSGQLTSAGAQIGTGGGSTGQVTISHNGNWSSSGAALIGGSGSGQLNVTAHFRSGSILGQPVGYFPAQGNAGTTAAVLGQNVGGSGTATIHGYWNTGDLTVGDAGTGVINMLGTSLTAPNFTNVSSVGRLDSNTVSIAAQPGSTGAVNLTGNVLFGTGLGGSPWNVAGNLAVGGTSSLAGGAGSVTVGVGNTLTVGGDLKIWPGGRLKISEGPANRINIAGVAQLGGTLEFAPLAMSDPQLNDEFEILESAEFVTGAFSSTILPPLESGLGWSVLYNPTSVTLRVVSTLRADFNDDGDVDGGDLERWRAGFGSATTHTLGDADADSDVDGADFLIWQRELGSDVNSVSAAEPVPEPASLALTVAALAGLLVPRSRIPWLRSVRSTTPNWRRRRGPITTTTRS